MMVNTSVDLIEEGKIETLLLPLSWWDMGSVQLAKIILCFNHFYQIEPLEQIYDDFGH